MQLLLKRSLTSEPIELFIQDSTSTAGAGKTGLTNASVTAYYMIGGAAAPVSITLANGTLGTWSSGGFKEIDATNMPGLYQLGIPNAALAGSSDHVTIMVKGAGIVPVLMQFQIEAIDLQDTVRMGLTALPNVAAGAAGGINTATDSSGRITGVQGNVTGSVGSVTGAVGGAVASVTAAVTVDLTQAVPTTNTAQTHGDCLNAARAQGFGKWVQTGTSLVLYANDGTTVLRTFTLDSSTAPTQRV